MMNPLLMTGMTIVIVALVFYSLFIRQEIKFRKVTPKLLRFLTIGVSLDITATLFMILGSTKTPFTIHGFIGYSALGVMLVDTILMWNLKSKNGLQAEVSQKLHRYSLIAYSWWVVAFVSGGIIAMVLD